MTIREIKAPERGTIDQWLVENGDAVERGTPLALMDIQGELWQIEAEYAGVVQSLKSAEGAFVLAHAVLLVLDAFNSNNRSGLGMTKKVADTKLNRDIRQIVTEVTTPEFNKVNGRLDGVDGRLNSIDGRLNSIDATLASINAKLNKPPSSPPTT